MKKILASVLSIAIMGSFVACENNSLSETVSDVDGSVEIENDDETEEYAETIESENATEISETQIEESYDGPVEYALVRCTSYGADDDLVGWYEYEYDDQGNVINQRWVRHTGRSSSGITYEYDNNGNLISSTDSTSTYHWYEYEYDGNNIVSAVVYTNSDVNDYRNYEYDDQGNLIVERVSRTPSSNQFAYCEYEYDEQGRLISVTWHMNQGDGVIDRIEYEYDEQGYLSKYTVFSSSGNIQGWGEYEYDYIPMQSSPTISHYVTFIIPFNRVFTY